MPGMNPSRLLPFDAVEAGEAVRELVEGPLYAFVEFDHHEFEILYVAEETLEYYGTESAMIGHFEEIHGYVNIDFTEIELYRSSLFPDAERVEYLTTGLDFIQLARIYFEKSGVMVALAPEEPVYPVVDTVRDHWQAATV